MLEILIIALLKVLNEELADQAWKLIDPKPRFRPPVT